MATVQTAPGCTRYQIYEAIIGSTKEHKIDLKCFNVNTVTDDECSDREEDVKVGVRIHMIRPLREMPVEHRFLSLTLKQSFMMYPPSQLRLKIRIP